LFSEWKHINKHSFTIIFGTLIWSILWQLTKVYNGNSIILKAIHSGFYYLVLADIYTFFVSANTIYNNNIYNQNYHDINYYGTLEMQPIRNVNNVSDKENIETNNTTQDETNDTTSVSENNNNVDK
jgi:hypothetical protein